MVGSAVPVVAWSRAVRPVDGHGGVVALAGSSILWSGLGTIGQSSRQIPLAAVSGLAIQDAGRAADLRFDSPGGEQRFRGKRPALQRLYSAIVAERPGAADATVSGSVVDELERLVALRDSGALTEAEYEAAKRQLFG